MNDQPKFARKITTKSLSEMKERGETIAALTAYDFLMAGLLDEAGVDVILVGDSVSTVVQGLPTTVSTRPPVVTMAPSRTAVPA